MNRFRLDILMRALEARLWLRPTLFALIASMVVIGAGFADKFVPWPFDVTIENGVIRSLLTIMASSMLAVTTFSVSVMLSAYSASISSSSPRAFDIVVAQSASKQVLSSFIGAFIFSVIGIVGLELGYFEETGRAVLFGITLWIFVWVTGTLVFWIDHVARLSTLESTIDKVSHRAVKALAAHFHDPAVGGTPVHGAAKPAQTGIDVSSARLGALRHVDVPELAILARELDASIHVTIPVGEMTSVGWPLCRIVSDRAEALEIGDETIVRIRNCFVVGGDIDASRDPVRPLRILSEIADRALSPGVNDPGTAIDVLDAIAEVFVRAATIAAERAPAQAEPLVLVPVVEPSAVFRAAFAQTARDGAAMVEVASHLVAVLDALEPVVPTGWRAALREEAAHARESARKALEGTRDGEQFR